MADPITLQVLDAVMARLQTISTANGFNTNPSFYLGVRRINDDQLDAGPVIHLYDLEDELDEESIYGDESIRVLMRMIIEAIVEEASENRLDAAHLLYQDIFNAVLDVDDRTLGGLSLDFGYAGRRMEYPESGGKRIAVNVEVTALIEQPYGNI